MHHVAGLRVDVDRAARALEHLALHGVEQGLAALAFGGSNSQKTEHYDGSAWTLGGNLLAARQNHGGCGNPFAALAIGGQRSSALATHEQYNGTTWLSGAASLASARITPGTAGNPSSAIAFGGLNGTPLGSTETWNGNTWAAGPNLATARYAHAGSGSSSSALSSGGYGSSGALGSSEKYRA